MRHLSLAVLSVVACCWVAWAQSPDECVSQPICPVEGGLQPQQLEERVQWFLARHPKENVTADLFQRWGPTESKYQGGRRWQAGVPQLVPPDPTQTESYLSAFPRLQGECWLYLTAWDRPWEKPSQPPFYLRTSCSEVYSFREGGDDSDRLEILETRQADQSYRFRCWIPLQARWSRPPRSGSLKNWPEERWQEMVVSQDFRDEANHLDRVWQEAEDKLKSYPAYYYAAEAARLQPGAKILELGSNHWPVMPIGVFPENPRAEFHTLDCHYSGLWLMEVLIQARRPQWQERIHRYLTDFSETFPLPDRSIDLAVSVAAFGMGNFQAEEAWATFLELERVLRTHGCFYGNCLDFESRPAWLTWAVLQHFRVRRDWNGGRTRNLCLEKRT